MRYLNGSLCVCGCVLTCVRIGMCARVFSHSGEPSATLLRAKCEKRAPGCESALHSSPESRRFRKHLIPGLRLRAPVRARRWRGIMKLFSFFIWMVQRCEFAVPHQCSP